MDRDEIRDRFSPLLDGELGPEERAEVEAALSEDAELLRELDALKRVDRLYANLPPVTAPDGFEEGIRSALRPAKLQFGPGRMMRRQMWPLLAAAAVFVVFGAIIVVQMNPERSRMLLSKTMPSADTEMATETAASQSVAMADRAEVPMSAQGLPEMQAPMEAELEDIDYANGSGAASSGATGNNSFRARRANGEEFAGAVPGKVNGRTGTVISDDVGTTSDRESGRVGLDVPARQRPAQTEQSIPSLAEPPSAFADTMAEASAPEMEQTPKQELDEAQVTASEPATLAAAPLPTSEAVDASVEKSTPSRMSRVQPAPTPVEAKAEDTAKRAGRAFHKKAEDWIQDGYKEESRTKVIRDSETWNQLVKKEIGLREILKLDGRIVFKLEDTWYELLPLKTQVP